MYPASTPNQSFLYSTFPWLLSVYRVNVKLLAWSARAFSLGLFRCPETRIPSGHSQSVCRCFCSSDELLIFSAQEYFPMLLTAPGVSSKQGLIPHHSMHASSLCWSFSDSLILFLHRAGILSLSSVFSAFSPPAICLCWMGIHETEQRWHLSYLPLYFWCLEQGLICNKLSLNSGGMDK